MASRIHESSFGESFSSGWAWSSPLAAWLARRNWSGWPWAHEGDSGPIDCGPPPPAEPHHQTGGESFPPLPLPATPLRRSEKKRPPSPPALVGKAALGAVRWTTRDGRRVQYRDWMTDPGDVIALLRWTADKLGINYRAVEVDFGHFSFDPRELPVLLLAGHNQFELDRRGSARLARYVMDGGAILGDACCGWNDFAEPLPPRDGVDLSRAGRCGNCRPRSRVFSSYYKLGDLTYKRGDGSTFREPPCLEGINFGCRAGVLFSPRDLTCGWDGHEHPRGLRVVIDEARQLGANMITYVLGTFQLGRFLSTTKVYHEAAAPGPRRLGVCPIDSRGRLGPRSVGRTQFAEVCPRPFDAGREVQAGKRPRRRPEGGDAIRCST